MPDNTQNRRLSLASGVLPEFDALTLAQAAAAAGYSDMGFMVRAQDWDTGQESALLDIMARDSLGVLDVEVLWIPAGGELQDEHQFIVDVGGRLGAEHLLVVSDEADPERLAPALARISDWCAPYAIRPMLEFLRITAVTSLQQAQELLHAATGHNFGILLDALHLARSGELSALPVLDAARHPYIQFCDGMASCAFDRNSLLEDAVDLRCAPGEGELPIGLLLDALPAATPLSLEVRSRDYRTRYADPTERAAAVLQQTQRYLQHYGENSHG